MGTGIIYGRMNTDYARNGCFLTRDEVNAILLVCKNYKLHFSRKCAERPFENVISIISKIPWHIPKIINTLHRDHIFELLKCKKKKKIQIKEFKNNKKKIKIKKKKKIKKKNKKNKKKINK